jgi:hypothetical protein
MALNRTNYATAAVMGCQMLSGFFIRYELGQKGDLDRGKVRGFQDRQSCQKVVPVTNLVPTSVLDCGARVFGSAKSGYFLRVH